MDTLFTFFPVLPEGAYCEGGEYLDGIFKNPEFRSLKISFTKNKFLLDTSFFFS